MKGCEILKWLVEKQNVGTYQMDDFEQEVEERIKDFEYVDPKGKVLLIGSSTSEITAWERKYKFTPDAIAIEDFKDERIKILDMHDLERDNQYDFIYCSQTLEHSPAPLVVLVQIYRALKSGSHAFLWIPDDPKNQKATYHYSCFPKYIWEDLLEKAGFKVEQTHSVVNSIGYLILKP